jgi:stearoyl-CoA desaturase (delta-9 desaturase)
MSECVEKAIDTPAAESLAASSPKPGRQSVPMPRPRPAALGGPRIEPPEGTKPPRILWPYVIGIGTVHLLGLLVFVPWFFTWTGVVVSVVSLYVFNTLGINLAYHRLLTHQGLKVPKWLEHILATLGACCLQDSPARWVAIHRLHHQHSDEPPDPHSPLVRFLWGHLGWLLFENRQLSTGAFYERYARDILKDPFYLRFERSALWFWAFVYVAVAYYVVGTAAGYFVSGTMLGAIQFGSSMVVWGVIVRNIVGWHITWSVNSVTHVWGYRNYDTNESSRNNILIGLISNGEGWHNNHHADQRSAAHGHKWWELDVTWITIRIMMLAGLATDVVYPRFKTANGAASPADSSA